MDNENNMIEINLNAQMDTENKKGFSYIGNIQFAKAQDGSFSYKQYRNENVEKSVPKTSTKFFDIKLPTLNDNSNKISCLRQMYCPDCQQRLDEDCILINRHAVCCFPLLLVTRLYKYFKLHKNCRIYCKNCGGDMGYLKCA